MEERVIGIRKRLTITFEPDVTKARMSAHGKAARGLKLASITYDQALKKSRAASGHASSYYRLLTVSLGCGLCV